MERERRGDGVDYIGEEWDAKIGIVLVCVCE